jgi:hypothetical protein
VIQGSWLALTWGSALLLCCPVSARAQVQRDQVVLTGGAVRSDVLEILRAAFAHDGIAFDRAAAAPDCAGTLADPALRARVWINWEHAAAGGEANGAMLLCFQDHCRSATRSLGPFAKLDARAREELITVIELGLSALPESCSESSSTGDSGPGAVAPANAPAAGEVQAPAALTAASSSAVHEPPADGAGHKAKPPAPAPGSGAPAQGHAEPPPLAATHASESVSPPSDATESSGGSAPSWQRQRFTVGVSYALAHWADGLFAQQLAAMVAYPVHAQPVYVGLELGFVPRFRAQRDELAIDASCVRLALQLWARWSLSQSLALDAQIGPAIEWLRLQPLAATTQVVSGTRTTSHGDPLLFVRVGPSLCVLTRLRIGLDVQLDTALIQRSFGFTQADAAISVFAPDRFRLSLALNARAEL